MLCNQYFELLRERGFGFEWNTDVGVAWDFLMGQICRQINAQ